MASIVKVRTLISESFFLFSRGHGLQNEERETETAMEKDAM
jgi:hypothetical protein